MPKAMKFTHFAKPRYTAVPDDLFDVLLPDLTESQLKVLLWIMRQSFGWGKDVAKMSLEQISKHVGMGVSTVKRALNELEELELIIRAKGTNDQGGSGPSGYSIRYKDDDKTPPVSGGPPTGQGDLPGPPIGQPLAHPRASLPLVLKNNLLKTNITPTPSAEEPAAQAETAAEQPTEDTGLEYPDLTVDNILALTENLWCRLMPGKKLTHSRKELTRLQALVGDKLRTPEDLEQSLGAWAETHNGGFGDFVKSFGPAREQPQRGLSGHGWRSRSSRRFPMAPGPSVPQGGPSPGCCAKEWNREFPGWAWEIWTAKLEAGVQRIQEEPGRWGRLLEKLRVLQQAGWKTSVDFTIAGNGWADVLNGKFDFLTEPKRTKESARIDRAQSATRGALEMIKAGKGNAK